MKVKDLIIADTDNGIKSIFKREEKTKHYEYTWKRNGTKGIVTCVDTITTYQDLLYGLKAIYAVYDHKPIQTRKGWLEENGANCKINVRTINSYSKMRAKMIAENNLPLPINPEETTQEEIIDVLNYAQSLNSQLKKR